MTVCSPLVLATLLSLYKVFLQRVCNKNEFYNKSERLIQKINTPTIDMWFITISKSRKCQRLLFVREGSTLASTRERAWKSFHARKGDTRWEERKMRDYRQSPCFWPFTPDWFWSVKFVSPSKSIKRIQWDSFPYWAVIALVIGKLRGIFIASKRKPRY